MIVDGHHVLAGDDRAQVMVPRLVRECVTWDHVRLLKEKGVRFDGDELPPHWILAQMMASTFKPLPWCWFWRGDATDLGTDISLLRADESGNSQSIAVWTYLGAKKFNYKELPDRAFLTLRRARPTHPVEGLAA